MLREKLKIITISSIIMLLSSSIYAQWQVDNSYGFKINVPSHWSKNYYMDGTDKVWDFMSNDENAAIQIRAFEATPQTTTDLIVQVYEEDMLPQGAVRLSLTNHVSNQGIRGKQGIYTFNYEGSNVSMGVFFAIKKGKGYVISAMIPTSMLDRKSAQVKKVTESFTLLGTSSSGSSSIGGISRGTMISKFKITGIQICDRLDQNNNAVNPHLSFGSQTAEINAVISFTGQTSKDLTVSWIYINWNRTITSDIYNFTDGNGVGVVSLSKPDNGWPVGNYKVVFKMDGKVIDSKTFEVKEAAYSY